MGPRTRIVALFLGALLACLPARVGRARETPVAAAPDAVKNSIPVWAGGQIAIASYKSFMKVGAGYGRWLRGPLWLDLGLTVLVHADTNAGLLGGVRWIFGDAPGFRPFVRTHLELAILRDPAGLMFAITPRGGGGIGWYSSPAFGMNLEGNVGLGLAVGQGSVHFAAAVDILLGVDIRF